MRFVIKLRNLRCNNLVGILLLAVFALFGCAEERAPINRVQANALPKSMFADSEWYAHQTVIDAPAQTSVTFVGDGSPLRRIRWDIQEKYLIARDSLQHIDAIENNGIAGSGDVQTGIVAMYAIESHFDIRRAYNSSTGEELNVIEENTTDRPWYQREYFRVDWSKNLVSNEDLALTSAFGGVKFDPVNYYVENPKDPFAPRFETNKDGEVNYIDIVNKYFAQPEPYELATGETVAACALVFSGNPPCEPAEIAVRNSFLRVDPKRDYEPMEYTSNRMERFGYFLTWRDTFDPDYGITAARRLRLVNRHNIWKQSHKKTSAGDYVACGTDQDCGGGGSVCDTTFARAMRSTVSDGTVTSSLSLNNMQGACTVPYRDRVVSPVAYHVSTNLPDDLFVDAQAFVAGWNSALQDTVGSLRALECEDTGGQNCDAQRDRDDAKHVFVLCHNPVARGDNDACGAQGTVARIGDLRYNIIGWVGDESKAGPLGFGPSFADPQTGEIISANALVYGAYLVRLTAFARDLLALINGDLDEAAVADNNDFAGWIRDIQSGKTFTAGSREADNHIVKVDGQDTPAINQSMSFDWIDGLLNRDRSTLTKPTKDDAIARFQASKKRLVDAVGDLHIADTARARIETLKGTDIEQLMIDDEMIAAAGYGPDTPLTDEVIEKASPLRDMSLDHLREMDSVRRQLDGRLNSCVLQADFVDEGLIGLVKEIDRAVHDGDGTVEWYGQRYQVARNGGIDYELVQQMLRHPIFNAVTAHEVGHTLGLRHNFSGSFDSLNYNHRYWELRDDGNMLPRAWDPMTQQEIDGRIREYQYSTVMDYGNNFVVTDANGIGHYDRAAIKMGYGDLVEVFTDTPEANKTRVAGATALEGFGWPGAVDILSSGPLRVIPYTEIPVLLGGTANLEKRADVHYSELKIDPNGFSDVLVFDSKDRFVVPYRYCGDEFSDYEPYCMRYDAGADEYETLTSLADTYWNYYLMNNFMRQRVTFDPDTLPDYLYTRFFAKFENANLDYTLFRGILGDFGADDAFFERQDGFGSYTAGLGAVYQLLTKIVATPEPGCHEHTTLIDGSDAFVESPTATSCPPGSALLNVDTFDGRALRTGYSLGPDSSFWFLTRSGYFQDKTLALQSLTDPGARVLGQDTDVDIRRFQVSFYTTFQKPIQNILRGIIGEDWATYAPRYSNGQLVFPDMTAQVTGQTDGVVVDPDVSFALQLYSMVYGMAYLPRTFDFSFIDRARLWVKGGAESVDLQLATGVSLIEFADDESGLVYQAPSYPDANGNETGVSAKVLLHAQELKNAGDVSGLHYWMANLNVLRRLTYLMGFGGDESSYL